MMKRSHHNCFLLRALKLAYIVHFSTILLLSGHFSTLCSIDAIAALFPTLMWGFCSNESLHTMIRRMNVYALLILIAIVTLPYATIYDLFHMCGEAISELHSFISFRNSKLRLPQSALEIHAILSVWICLKLVRVCNCSLLVTWWHW